MTIIIACSIILLLVSTSAFAHPLAQQTSFEAFVHPFMGLDHLLTALAVGMLMVRMKGHKIWLPALFLTGMTIGCMNGFGGVKLPLMEGLVLFSLVVLVGLLFTSYKLPFAATSILLVGFGFAHGYAHGIELSGASSLQMIRGLLLATGLIHMAGFMLAKRLRSERFLRKFA